MSAMVEQVLQQLRAVIGEVDQAATAALGAQQEARQAVSCFAEAGFGSDHPQLNRARHEARTAAVLSGKTARLLAQAASAFAEYVNVIAPGTVPAHASAPESAPSGERLASEAPNLGSRFDSFLRRIGPTADDDQEAVATAAGNIGAGVHAALRDIFGDHGDHGATTRTSEGYPDESGSRPGGPVGEAVSALLYSALAVAVAVKGVRNYLLNRQEGHRVDGDE